MTWRVWALAGALTCGISAGAGAQDTVVVARPGYRVPAAGELAREAVEKFNAASNRFFGSMRVRLGDRYDGDVAAIDGPLVVEGDIRGSLIAINADVELGPRALVDGDLLVVGGTLNQDPTARITGNVNVSGRRVDVRRDGERVELERDVVRPNRRRTDPRRYAPPGHASILVGAEGTYNRVEGLPYRAGARIDWFGDFNGRIEAVAIARTVEPLDSVLDRLGYRAGGRLGFGEGRILEVGGSAYDVIVPIEDWQLADDEVGLASVLLRRDYRDYYGKRGVSGYVSLSPSPLFTITGEMSRDDERSVSARDPWSLRRRNEVWRPNPGIDEGRFTHFRARVEYDSRGTNRWSDMPRWLLRGEWEVGHADSVSLAPLAPDLRGALPSGRFQYGRLFIDLRRYQPIGRSGELRLRTVLAGDLSPWADSLSALPPLQRRFTLGGPDPMPGYRFGEFSCHRPGDGLSTSALCREFVLFQAEYRGSLDFGVFSDYRDRHDARREAHPWPGQPWQGHEGSWFGEPQVVLFADGGTASGVASFLPLPQVTGSGGWKFDLGAGLEFGSVGFYVARATTSDAPIRFSLRLHHRF